MEAPNAIALFVKIIALHAHFLSTQYDPAGCPENISFPMVVKGRRRTVLKFGKLIPFIEYRSAAKLVLSKSTPK
ncbi:hypothetical protein TNCV_4357081 [Trichonephila clavipes]|nr:hypothetical protein TNCV_4357081 [Trichonephila clavipes]